MEILETMLSGCYELIPNKFVDNRGSFIKTFNIDLFENLNLNTVWHEDFYSVSHKNVIRGMHFQLPPYDHVKLVYCISGVVLDVVVDLRPNSATYKRHYKIELSSDKANILYIPKGFAHGFKSMQDNTIMAYKTSTVYNKQYDDGVHWDSCGIDWEINEEKPLISQRDSEFITLDDFVLSDYDKK